MDKNYGKIIRIQGHIVEVEFLENFPNLHLLNLSGTPVTGTGLAGKENVPVAACSATQRHPVKR